MTETYSLSKNIPMIGLDIDITVEDKNLLLELDNAIRDVVVKHYGLKVDLKKVWLWGYKLWLKNDVIGVVN